MAPACRPLSDEELTDIQAIDDNGDRLARLVAQLRSPQRVVPFVGAGLSIPLGYPGWSTFLLVLARGDDLADHIQTRLDRGEYEEAADDLLNAFGEHDLHQRIQRAFKDEVWDGDPRDSAVGLLPRLCCGPVLTTNYDHVLERVYERAGRPFADPIVWGVKPDLLREALRLDKRYLVKIHGDVRDRGDRILTLADYKRHYGGATPDAIDFGHPLPRLLSQLFQGRPLLFLGCSLGPDRTRRVLGRVIADYGDTVEHFAIVERPADVDRWRAFRRALSALHITPIWYPHDRHDLVGPLLAWLLDQVGPCGADMPPAAVTVDPKTVFVGREGELADLERALLAPGGAAHRALVCGAHGMAGVGKTWLIEHFFTLHSDAFPGGLVRLVLDPTTAINTDALFGRLADALTVRRDAVADALRGGGYLVHVENVDSRPLAEEVAKLAEGLPGARLAVSGRFTAFQARPGWHVISVQPFDLDIGLKQLADELNTDAAARVSEADRRTLVGALGGLPLAIHLAAGYLNAGRSAAGFLASLGDGGLDLSPYDVNDRAYAHRAEQALSAAFDLSLTIFEAARPADLPALLTLAVAPRAGFGPALAAAVMDRDPFAAEEVLVEAAAVSLVERVPVAERADAAWRVHALVAERLRARLAEERAAAESRLAAWFLAHLTEGEADGRGARWQAVEAEREGLIEWLAALSSEASRDALMAGYEFGLAHGPLAAWLAAAARALAETADDVGRSNLLWRQGNLALQAGELDLALQAAQAKEAVDLARTPPDERGVALARGLRADALAARGEVDEALRIRRQEELPVYERLGDVRSRAVTMGKIADALAARGEVDEALRIRRQEQLPVYERLGDVRELLVGRANLALDLLRRGAPGDHAEAVALLRLALVDARRLRIPEAGQIEQVLAAIGAPTG